MTEKSFEDRLLESAATDAPSAERRAANRAAVMRAAGFGGGGVGGPGAPPTGEVKRASLAKLGVFAAAAAVAGVGIAVLAWPRATENVEAPTAASSSASTSPADVGPPPPAAARSAATAIASTDAVAATSTSEAVGSDTRRPVAEKPRRSEGEDPLAVETRILEAARRCLDAGDVACASAKLDEHARRFPRPVLADEAALLRVEIARAGGDVARARKLAEAMIRSNPTGPYARRARKILASLPSSAP